MQLREPYLFSQCRGQKRFKADLTQAATACTKTIVQLVAPCSVQKVHQVDQNASSMRHQVGDCGFLPVTQDDPDHNDTARHTQTHTASIFHYSSPRKQIVFVHLCPIHNSIPWRDTGIKQKRGAHRGAPRRHMDLELVRGRAGP